MTRTERISESIAGQSPLLLFLEALALVAGIGVIDYVTGYEVAIFPFYSIPILLVVWFSSNRAAIAISVFSTVAWFWADAASGHKYSQEWLRLWDTVVRMMFFCLVVFAGATVRSQRDAHRARIELLERSQRLEQEIISVSEREQERIGRDFHDGVCQYLAAISFTAGVLKQDLEEESNARSKTARLRTSSRTPSSARATWPAGSRRWTATKEAWNPPSRICRPPPPGCSRSPARLLPPDRSDIRDNTRAIHLFRIAQEALSNAVKHGKASHVTISLQGAPEAVSLRVIDDGIGFDPRNSVRSGMGLNIMRYRARTLGGTLDIHPNLPSGTIVACSVDAAA